MLTKMQTIIEFYFWRNLNRSMSHYSPDPRFYNHPSVNGQSDPRVSSRQRTASTWNKTLRTRAMSAVETTSARSWPVRTTRSRANEAEQPLHVSEVHHRQERSVAIKWLLTESIHCFLHTKSAKENLQDDGRGRLNQIPPVNILPPYRKK